MAISSYEKDGKVLWRIYVNVRSKIYPSLRRQKAIEHLPNEKMALAEEKKWLQILTEQVVRLETKGVPWELVIDRWELAMRSGVYKNWSPVTLRDYVAIVRKWTEPWNERLAAELTKADGRDVLRFLEAQGKSRSFQGQVKNLITTVFNWGIEERLIKGVSNSPVEGLQLSASKGEQVPEIFTLKEIRDFLEKAKALDHPWYPVWVMAILTGMRNGELHALLWSDVDFENHKVTVSKSYNTRSRAVKCTKAGYWRTAPISSELLIFLHELKARAGNRKQVLPRFYKWDKGWQAKVLRAFCVGVGLPSVRFHALRACFATQVLGHDVAPARVMKICGWKDLKTMQHYIRLAGVDERGATECLRVLPNDEAAMGEVVNLFEFKGRPPEGAV
jgi:integrase